MTQDEDERATTPPAARAGAAGGRCQEAPRGSRRPIDAAGRARIGRGLRLHYAEVLALPIPERLRTLIDDLAACSDTEAKR